MATQAEDKLQSLVAELRALERKLTAHLEEHAREQRESEEHERSMLAEVGADSLEEFEAREAMGAGTSELDAVVNSMTYEEWQSFMEED